MGHTPAAALQFWRARVRRLQWGVNLAAWAEPAGPAVFAAGAVVAAVLYASRRTAGAGGLWTLGMSLPWIAAAVAAVLWSRARWISRTDARSLLDYHLGLECRLSAAEVGVGAWPDPDRNRGVLRWRAGPLGGWVAGVLALLAAATYAPLPAADGPSYGHATPPSVSDVTRMVAEARELQVADPVALEQIERKADELAAKPAAEQFSHAGLEAADALRSRTSSDLASLGSALQRAGALLGELQAEGTPFDPKSPTAQALDSALSDLASNGMPLATEWMQGMPADAAAAFRQAQLSPDAIKSLASRCTGAGSALKGIAGAAQGEVSVAGDNQLAWWKPGQKGPGRGGVDRGRGDAPLSFTPNETDSIDGTTGGLSASKYTDVALGDLLRVTREAPPKTGEDNGPAAASAGGLSTAAQGGDAVWVDQLTPSEREALRKFFK